MPFAKLDCKILESSLWIDHEATRLFVTALLMAKPHRIETETPAVEVRKLKPAGFTVPPGMYGLIDVAGVGIVQRSGLERSAGLAALERLCAVDEHTRTLAHDGRRLARIDGGFIVLNFAKYRELDLTNAERQKRYRKAHPAESNAVTTPLHNAKVTEDRRQKTDIGKDKPSLSDNPKGLSSPPPPAAAGGRRVLKGQDVVNLFHATCPTLPKVQRLTPERRKHVASRAKAAEGEPLEWFRRLFEAANASDFLAGRAGTFKASFDWLLSPTNSQKTLEGNYANDNRQPDRTKRTDDPKSDKFAGWGDSPAS